MPQVITVWRAPAALNRAISRLGVLQIDSVNVFERAHYLPLLARVGPYDRADLDKLLHHDAGRGLGRYTEYLAHEAAVLPVADWPLWAWRRELPVRDGFREWAAERGTLIDEVVGAAGLRNIAHEFGLRGTGILPLEALVMADPDIIAVADQQYGTPALAQQNFRHPAFLAFAARKQIAVLPSALTVCGGPFTLEAVRLLQEAAKKTESR